MTKKKRIYESVFDFVYRPIESMMHNNISKTSPRNRSIEKYLFFFCPRIIVSLSVARFLSLNRNNCLQHFFSFSLLCNDKQNFQQTIRNLWPLLKKKNVNDHSINFQITEGLTNRKRFDVTDVRGNRQRIDFMTNLPKTIKVKIIWILQQHSNSINPFA